VPQDAIEDTVFRGGSLAAALNGGAPRDAAVLIGTPPLLLAPSSHRPDGCTACFLRDLLLLRGGV